MFTPNSPMIVLITVMILSGAFGGSINYLISKSEDPERASLKKSLVVGTGASFLVPLFLNMISSNLIQDTKTDNIKVLVFAGFCLVAAISSASFITTLSDRVLSAAKEAKKVAIEAKHEAEQAKDEIEEVQATITEPEPQHQPQLTLQTADADASLPKRVLDAIATNKYAYRTLRGISRETGIDKDTLKNILDEMVQNGVLGLKMGKAGNHLWYVTDKGIGAPEGNAAKVVDLRR